MSGRLAAGQEWEDFIVAWLNLCKWPAFRYGQGLLDNDAHRILRKFNTHIRWAPDIIATDPAGSTLFVIDAKNSSAERYGNHAVETASTKASALYHEPDSNVWALYAFPHPGAHSAGQATTPMFVTVDVWSQSSNEKPYLGQGSGTPFRVAPCYGLCQANPFDAIALSQQYTNPNREELT